MTPREKSIALLTAGILGGALLLSEVVDPAIERYKGLIERQELNVGVLERERALSSRVSTLVKRRRVVQETLVPSEGESLLPWLMGHVRELTQEAGFKSRSLRFVSAQSLDGPTSKSPFVELRLELRVKTSPKKLQDFLVRLAASERHVRVRSLTTVPDPKGQVEATLLLLALAPREATRGLGAENQ